HALGCDEIGEAAAGPHRAFDLLLGGLLAQSVPGHRDLPARLVGVQRDVVVVHAVGRPETHHAAGGQPAPFDQALEHALAVGVHAHGFGAHDLVLEDR